MSRDFRPKIVTEYRRHNGVTSKLRDSDGLTKEVIQKINEVDQATSTLTSAGIQGFSARIVEKKPFHNSVHCYNLLVEIIKKPGQTLGLYLREGNGDDRNDGVFVSRIAENGELQKCDVLIQNDEILSVNQVDISRICLDDVVIMMSIPKRILLHVVRKECTDKSMKQLSLKISSPIVTIRQKHNGNKIEVVGENYIANICHRHMKHESKNGNLASKYLRNSPKRNANNSWRSSVPIDTQECFPTPLSSANFQPNDNGTDTLSTAVENIRKIKQSNTTNFHFLTKSNSLPKQNVPLLKADRWKRSFDVGKVENNMYNGSAPELPIAAAADNDYFYHYSNERYPDTQMYFPEEFMHEISSKNVPRLINYSPQPYHMQIPLVNSTDKKSLSIIPSLTGVLIVHVIEGRGLQISDKIDMNEGEEMYCVIQIDGDHRARTEISNHRFGFYWNEVFEIDVCDCRQADFYIYSWHPNHRRTLRHRGRLRLPEALITGRIKNQEQCFALCLEPKGQLLIRVGYHSTLFAYRRITTSRRNAYWGVSLSVLVIRENDPEGSPLLLKRMLNEVERRCVDVPGLYTMCASLEKKLHLKHQLEIYPSAANLDSVSVPDPNLITTLIKDFLRELPEPVVPSCTYQMLVDAWRVLLPNNREGNSKLMLEVLDCLPVEHKSTFIVLMDHLKFVVFHSHQNGLSSEKLSRIFGPLIFCTCRPIESKSTRIPINYLDYRLASFVFEVLLDLWNRPSSNCDKSENGAILLSANRGADLESYC